MRRRLLSAPAHPCAFDGPDARCSSRWDVSASSDRWQCAARTPAKEERSMRLVTFRRRTDEGIEQRAGVQLDGCVLDLAAADEAASGAGLSPDLLTFIAGGHGAIDGGRRAVEF